MRKAVAITPHIAPRNFLVIVTAVLLALCISFAHADPSSGDVPDMLTVTPYRPTVSSPAALPVPGHFELESGIEYRDVETGETERSLNYLAKYAFNPNIGILFGGDAYVHQRSGVDRRHGIGDSFVTLKMRLPGSSDETAYGIELSETLLTAEDDLGADKPNTEVNLIGSFDLSDAIHTDININGTRLGQVDEGSHTQWGWASATSFAMGNGLGLDAELSGSARQGDKAQSEALLALTWAYSKRTVFDLGAAHRLSNTGDRRRFLSGVSILF